MAYTIAITRQKSSVGKITSCFSLAGAFIEARYKAVVADMHSKQRSAVKWVNLGERLKPIVKAMLDKKSHSDIDFLKKNNDVVIVNAAPELMTLALGTQLRKTLKKIGQNLFQPPSAC